jgi:hypothetical protein
MSTVYSELMFSFTGSPVPVRDDLRDAHVAIWRHLAQPGQVFNANERHVILTMARNNSYPDDDDLGRLASTLYGHPAGVSEDMVRSIIAGSGEAAVVETVALVSMLAAVDCTHRALGAGLEPLPEPMHGEPSGNIATGLRKRRTHVAMPTTSITGALDLLPTENAAYASACGPLYMTFAEMSSPVFERSPGLNRAQLETIAARTSILNECFY